MGYFRKFLFLLVSCLLFFSCEIGLGEKIDLDAPDITVTKMVSGGTDTLTFETTIYTKQNVTFYGTAADNVELVRVYAEVKWLGETDYHFLQNASLNGGDWEMPVSFGREGACWIKFVAEDRVRNYGVSSSKVVTLFVDEKAPVGEAWYIDRKVNGIQYGLQKLDTLKAIVAADPKLTKPSNIDVAQNGSFDICSTFNDASGIALTTISIFDEAGNKVGSSINKTADSGMYAPKFEINGASLGLAASGCTYYQVRYSSKDIVENPGANEVTDEEVEMGWFIWWPEMDKPRCSITGLTVDEATQTEVLNLNVGDSLNITVFDDDELSGTVTCKIDGDDHVSETPTAQSGEREKNIVLKAPENPQQMTLTVSAKDKNGKTLSKTVPVYVKSDTLPTLIIQKPENNQIPSVSTDADANILFEGLTLDRSGCTNLEFVWVPDGSDKTLAKKWLESIKTNHPAKPSTGATKIEGTGDYAGLTMWTAALKDENDASVSPYKKQTFSFSLSSVNDFGSDKAKDKYFYVRVTRKDGNVTDTELKLSADNLVPEITPKTPSGNMAIIDQDQPLVLEFEAKKSTGLMLKADSFKIYDLNKAGNPEIAGTLSGNTYKINTAIPTADLDAYNNSRVNPKYKFVVEDIFGNSAEAEYQCVISSLPSIKAVSSSAPAKCKAGDSILINVSFTKGVTCDENSTFLKLTNIVNNIAGSKKTAADKIKAKYKSGNGSTTLVFEYIVEAGDTSSELKVFNNKNTEGPIVGLSESNVHQLVLEDANNLQSKRASNPITIDGIAPVASSVVFITDADTSNKITAGGKTTTYLRAGRKLTAKVRVSEDVTVQQSPEFVFNAIEGKSISLNYEKFDKSDPSNKYLVFSKIISDTDCNGSLSYSGTTCIKNAEGIKDSYGNPVSLQIDGTETNIVIDTEKPGTPAITLKDNNGAVLDPAKGKYIGLVKVELTTNAPEVTEYYDDVSKTWKTYSAAVEIKPEGTATYKKASVIARRTDYAGNVSPYSDPINLEVSNSFPSFTVECTNVNGNYNYENCNELTFKVYFASPVNIASDSTANIVLSGCNAGDTVTAGAKAELIAASKGQTNVTEATFAYTVQKTDEFTLKVATNGVNLAGITDQYGISGYGRTLASAYERQNVRCDSVAPFVKTMAPVGKGTAINGINVYSGAKEIALEFNEEVTAVSGKIYLRQVDGWAIPPVFTASEFTKVLNVVKEANTTIGTLSGTEILYMNGIEDSEWLFGAQVGPANDRYHGTGQYVGPYKKSTQGVDSNGNPDWKNVKYVLDFDLDIWDGNSKKGFGYTFTQNRSSGNAAADSYHRQSTTNSITFNDAANLKEISTGNIRTVLEQAHFHERYMDVNSVNVEINNSNKKKVTLKFPKGVLEDDALPDGRRWELVIERGAFIDSSGNKFGAVVKDDIETKNGVTKRYYQEEDAVQPTNSSTTKAENWARKRTEIPAGENPLILIQDGSNAYFLSSGVAKPVIRVDRYSYGLGILQPSAIDETKTTAAEAFTTATVGGNTSSTDNKPTGYIRGRIDCETAGATVSYQMKTKSNSFTEDQTYQNLDDDHRYNDSEVTDCYSFITTTTFTSSDNYSTAKQKLFFLGGNGDYKQSCKQLIKATATYNGSTQYDNEGIFQTVFHAVAPRSSTSVLIADRGTGYDDYSIRGTTGFAGEPYIAPFPLRDSQIASPFLRRTFKDGSDYYWVSYEILVMSSVSSYGHHHSEVKYDWGHSWGKLQPGEFTRCIKMLQW